MSPRIVSPALFMLGMHRDEMLTLTGAAGFCWLNLWETSSAYLRAGPNSVRALERNRTQPLRSCSYPHVRPTSTERRARSKSQKQKGERTCDLA